MIANLSIPMESKRQGGDQLVSKVVTTAISALLRQTELLEVNVRAEPVAKLLQGSVDGFDCVGQGLLMHSGLQVDQMEFHLQALSIDFGALFRGQVQLRQPTQASMRIALTEDNLTESFNTPFLKEKLQQLSWEGQSLMFERTRISVNEDQSLRMQSWVRQGEAEQLFEIDITARVEVENRRKLKFVEVTYGGDPTAVALGQMLTEHVNQLLDLDQFALDGMQLRVDQLRLRNKQLTLYGVALIEKFPQRNRGWQP
ncbi:hypothetical protein C1752_08969 [Acaryochloris thomasi RCC1774]|uniref:DUF2993 domain-containing protein n=1 Tax=Acaryochloris thomasi RCC1774 TaxID=1764569 RepID=A0A2W1JPK9_9CYAN|nr:DUF2993 domain-containing protein [Acaryochloris thomasi]PZD70827.1 hypothetical protein C1752_08969 [Acaryochloris thomasi RCC1774]